MKYGLEIGTAPFRQIVDDPALPMACGLEAAYDDIVALYPDDQQPLYRYGYEPDGKEAREVLPLGELVSQRLTDYYQYFNQEENIGTGDCFSLIAHLSSGQPLETIQGTKLRYNSRGSAELASPDNLVPGGVYFMGQLAGAQVCNINHWMLGIGRERVLARWGQRTDSAIGIGTTSMTTNIYGGRLFRLHGELFREEWEEGIA